MLSVLFVFGMPHGKSNKITTAHKNVTNISKEIVFLLNKTDSSMLLG